MITVYTDGSCYPNPGPGGWAAVLLVPPEHVGIVSTHDQHRVHHRMAGGIEVHLLGCELETTNNRMEMLAAIAALEHLNRGVPVRLHTDSQYVQRGITEWVDGWVRRGWRTASQKSVQNVDLWERLIRQRDYHEVDWRWVRGHSGDHYNERVDTLAGRARERRLSTTLRQNEAAHI